jgi:phospholipase/carboxylesterase
MALACAHPCVASAARILHGQTKSNDQYLLIQPAHDAADRKYPLFLFLHGQRGSPDETVAGHATEFAGREFFILLPRAPDRLDDGYSWYDRSDDARFVAGLDRDERLLKGMIEEIARAYPIDRSRVFLCGFSSGARVSLYVGFRNPRLFRAVLPIGGYYVPELLDPYVAGLGELKISLYHGTYDTKNSFQAMNEAYEDLRRRGVAITLTTYPLGHAYDGRVLDDVFREVK